MHPAPKIAALQILKSAGLPVPAWVALQSPHDRDPTRWSEISELLQSGPVIVRTALFDEDREQTAAAGLGTSIPDCHDLPAIHRALTQISTSLINDPWLQAHLGPDPRAQVLVQHQVLGPWLAVIAQGLTRHVELHARTTRDRPEHEPLALGTSPTLAGPLDLLTPDLRDQLAPLCDRITAALPPTPHGLDLELAADTTGAVWVVQARPLTRPLHPEWQHFATAAADELTSLPGLWTLDAEHNPAPLSPAHAGLIRHLAAQRPDLVTARVLAGWLYEPSRPRTTSPSATTTIAAASPTPSPAKPTANASPATPTANASPATPAASPTPAEALHVLRHKHIPAARAWLTVFDHALATTDPAHLFARACEHFLALLTTYAALRVPASETPATALHCLQDREAHLDVLPAVWDIASPPLADLSLPTWPQAPVPKATSEDDDATLLRELDDHLFALGLAPLRRLYLRCAAQLRIAADDIFLLTPDELLATLRGASPPNLAARRHDCTAQAALFPPLQLLNGLPVPAPARTYLQGLAIGPPHTGPLHPRRDLADLLARPLPIDAVLAIPALTAQAAVALHTLKIKAVCCEHGGAMSHAALMARELGLSALIGCRGCTALPEGTRVHLDTRTSRLRPQI